MDCDPVRFAEDHALGRQAFLDILLPLIFNELVIGLPRLDQIDSESAYLFADVLSIAELVDQLDLNVGIRVVGGVSDSRPSKATRAILDLPLLKTVIRDDLSPSSKPELSPEKLRTLGFLLAAPAPMPLNKLCALTGMAGETLSGRLRPLHESGYVYNSEFIGAGSGLFELTGMESAAADAATILRDSQAHSVPEARLSVDPEDSQVLATNLGDRAMSQHDYRAAASFYAKAVGVQQRKNRVLELCQARALAGSNRLDAALGIFQGFRKPDLSAAEQIEFGRLAFSLYEQGMADADEVEQVLRKAERVARGSSTDIELRVLRAQVLLKDGESKKASTLLRRVLLTRLDQAPANISLDYYLTFARANHAMGKHSSAVNNLAKARIFANCAMSRLKLELVSVLAAQNETDKLAASRAAISAAFETGNSDVLGQLITQLGATEAHGQLQKYVSKTQAASRHARDKSTVAGFSWLKARGAVLMAGMNVERDIEIHPPTARSKVGISAWLEGSVLRLKDFPNTQMTDIHALPNTGTFSGDVLMTASNYAGLNHVLVLFRKDRMRNIHELLEVLNGV
ncbi:MAG: hypothetical protein ACYTDT_07745 [Planctomycetota bacterium]